jgi:recombination protein RecR
MTPLAFAMTRARDTIIVCETCSSVDTTSPCTICADPRRDPSMICVVEEVGDLWALERAVVMKGRYHVLGGTLSPLDGVGPEELNIAGLVERARSDDVKEILLALNATVEGQSTAHYLMDRLEETSVTITQLAHGVPIGGELDYLDEGTLAAAIKARKTL